MKMAKMLPCFARLLGVALVLLGFSPQWAHPATAAAPAATASPPPKPPPPAPPPPSVLDDVNPFADPDNLPQLLKWPSGSRPTIQVDVQPIKFDGLDLFVMIFKGPDFEWQLDPLRDFQPTPANSAESVAFVYEPKPVARLSIALYATGELLPDFTPASLAQYLAVMRAPSPKNFILLTPFPKNATFVHPEGISGFQAQSVKYAIVSDDGVTIHNDTFLDLNHEYIMLVSLVGPQALVEKLIPTVHAFLNNSRVLKGLGVKEVKPAPGAPASTAPSDT